MNRAKPTRKILFVLTCLVALLALAPVALAVGDDEMETEPPAAAVATAPVDPGAAEETGVLHAQVVRGLPFSNFDLLALIAVLVGISSMSFAVHRLNRDPAEQAANTQITTDAG